MPFKFSNFSIASGCVFVNTMAEKKVLLIIDSNSIIHRAFHALPALSTSKGEMVNAAYGFLLVLFRAIKEFHPEYIAACFDVKGKSKRQEKFKEYKAKREKAPDELYNQMPLVKDFLGALNVPVYEKKGFEADDLIGTIAAKAPRKQVEPPLEIVILSGDMDTLQLVNAHTKVFTSRKGLQDSVLYDEQAVRKRFEGLSPKQLQDYKGLRGDPSDNIPGVTGVGEKTAIQLLNAFGSLENLYKELEEKTDNANALKPRTREMLLQYKDQAVLSKELGTIENNVPLDFTLKELAWRNFDKEKLKELLRACEFRTLEARVSEIFSLREIPQSGTDPRTKETEADNLTEKFERLYKEGVFSKTIYELEKSLIPIIREMEQTGIQIYKPTFQKLSKEIAQNLTSIQKKIFELAGTKKLNINSPSQLSKVLFEKLALPQKGLHKTPGGALSTASPELQKLESLHPVVAEILKYRELAKLQNTYLLPLPLLADSASRIHAHFDQLGAATGRLSSDSPNLQNIPVQGEWGKKIRKGFVAASGFTLAAFDYSQMELRIASDMAGETKMQNVFKENKDIHQMTASEAFGVAQNQVTEAMRYRAKALNFGILYGMGARGFSQSAGIPPEEAQRFIEDYFLRFPKIAEYVEHTKEFAREHGYVETMFGRKRYLPDVNSQAPHIRAAAERAAVNHPIQGTAADIIKMAMVKISQQQYMGKLCRLVLQIHDELLFEISDDILKEVAPRIKKAMEEIVILKAPLVVQIKKGPSWGELTPLL